MSGLLSLLAVLLRLSRANLCFILSWAFLAPMFRPPLSNEGNPGPDHAVGSASTLFSKGEGMRFPFPAATSAL